MLIIIKKSYTIFYHILAVILFTLVLTKLVPSLADIKGYESYADQREFFGIKFFAHTISSIPFIVFGMYGLDRILYQPKNIPCISKFYERVIYEFAFIISIVIGICSIYFHIGLSDNVILCDKIPSLILFILILAIVLIERIDEDQLGFTIMFPLALITISCFTALQIHYLLASNEFRQYIIIEFLPILLAVTSVLFFKSKYNNNYFWHLILINILISRICDYFDLEIYNLTFKLISGHTLNHLTCSLAIYYLAKNYMYLNLQVED